MSGEDDIEHDTDETGAAELTQDLAEASIPSATSLVAIVAYVGIPMSLFGDVLLWDAHPGVSAGFGALFMA